jgi:hypothetical protein
MEHQQHENGNQSAFVREDPVARSKIVYVHTKIGPGDRSSGRLSL